MKSAELLRRGMVLRTGQTRSSIVALPGTPVHAAAVLSAVASHLVADQGFYMEAWVARAPGAEGRVGEPVAALVSNLWDKLSHRDSSLKPIADGFRFARFSGIAGGAGSYRQLDPLVQDATTYDALRALSSPVVD